MENHISFEEMAEVLLCKTYDAHFVQRIGRINAHIMDCEACRDTYMAMLTFAEAMESAARGRQDAALGEKAAAALKRIRAIVDLTIGQARDLAAQGLAGLGPFFTPTLAVAPRSTGGSAAPAAPVVANGDGIRMELRGSDTLVVYLPVRLCREGDIAVLQSREDPGRIVLRECRAYDRDTVCARFSGVRPDAYTLKIGPKPELD